MNEKIRILPDQTVFNQDDEGDTAYLVVSGSLVVERDHKRVGNLSSGEIFGELGQLMSRSRSVTAKARSKCSATFIPKDVLLEKFDNADAAIKGIFRAVAVRLKKSNEELEILHEKCDKLHSDNAKLHGEVARLKRTF